MTFSSEEFYNRRTLEARQDPRSVAEILEIALTADEDTSCKAILDLQWRATREVFEAAVNLISGDASKARIVGINVLAQLGIPERVYHEEILALLLPMLETETDPDILQNIAIALGHNRDPRVIEPLLRLKNHPHEDVRYGVTYGLLTYEEPCAVTALIELSQDVDEDVRDWATFGLGQQLDLDTPEIRDALYNRINDPHTDTQDEALMGLARRKDPRVLEPIIQLLTTDTDTLTSFAMEMAFEVAHTSLCPALLKLQVEWANDNDSRTEMLSEVLKACGCI